jgi:hypothetical protein
MKKGVRPPSGKAARDLRIESGDLKNQEQEVEFFRWAI